MSQEESLQDAGYAEQEAVVKKITAKEFDAAFDSMATFLFEQYKKHKEKTSSEPSQEAI